MLTAMQWQRLLRKKRSEMWRKVGRVLLVLVIWGAIAAYIACSAMLTQRHKSEQSVERVEIEIVDSASSGQLITSQRVKEMLIERGIATINTNVDKVDTRAIKDMICNEGFVDDVDISCDCLWMVTTATLRQMVTSSVRLRMQLSMFRLSVVTTDLSLSPTLRVI